MVKIHYRELVITCEGCRRVQRYRIHDYEECERIFKAYQCPGGCSRSLYSYFTVGVIRKRKEGMS